MHHTTLIVPGFHGSGPAHWQSWLETQLPDARRVRGIDWEAPVLARWAGEVRREIDAAPGAVWIVAHSFGCLASVVAASDRPAKVGGLLLVAPADPGRFSSLGLRDGQTTLPGLGEALPQAQLPCPSLVVGSRNDPWLCFEQAAQWAERWGSRLIDLGPAGHVNTESGYGPWPHGLELLQAMQQAHADLPLGSITDIRLNHKGRRGALARLRHHTRFNLPLQAGEAG